MAISADFLTSIIEELHHSNFFYLIFSSKFFVVLY